MTNKGESWTEVASRTFGVSASEALSAELQAARNALLHAKRYLAAKFELTDAEKNSLACLDDACVLADACNIISTELRLRDELIAANLEIARLQVEHGQRVPVEVIAYPSMPSGEIRVLNSSELRQRLAAYLHKIVSAEQAAGISMRPHPTEEGACIVTLRLAVPPAWVPFDGPLTPTDEVEP